MSVILERAGEDVSDYYIGQCNDRRLARTGALLFKRICDRMTTCIKYLAGSRKIEVAFSRFLGNSRVDTDDICQNLAEKTNAACYGKKHVLCLQDTVQLTYPTQPVKKKELGYTGDANTKGLFCHPGIIVDAANRDVLGISSVISWVRDDEDLKKKDKKRPIEEKESIRWIDTATMATERMTAAEILTVIGDRESDILELFNRIPDKKTHLIVRASHDRNLATDEKISERLNESSVAGTHCVELPRITGQRKKRDATLEIKYTAISIDNSSKNETIELNCVFAKEVSSVPGGEKPISWVLLTTHDVSTLEDAIQILTWYTWRWVIEQIFRTMKSKGLQIEESQIETPAKLLVLSVLSIAAAVRVMCLVEARDGHTDRDASDLFTDEEILLLKTLCLKIEGKTKKQKNPYRSGSLAWAAWVIARLGGWNGYASESPPGPITMLRGLRKFETTYEGWAIAREDVCIG